MKNFNLLIGVLLVSAKIAGVSKVTEVSEEVLQITAVTEPLTKTVTITGPVTAPFVPGTVCVRYRDDQQKIVVCADVHAGKDYVFTVPEKVGHVKVCRVVKKECKRVRNGREKCFRKCGKFGLYGNNTDLNLSYDHKNVLNNTERAEYVHNRQTSNFGIPNRYPSNTKAPFNNLDPYYL